jgi:hypothetical protein
MRARIITVADREGDFYEFLHALVEAKEEFVVRAKYDRYTGKTHRHVNSVYGVYLQNRNRKAV